jgi:hypothetical protein
MIYLEVAACRLTALPEDMAKLTPNLRVLNLNYNFLEDARPLEGLTRLEKLTIIGSRLQKTKPLIRLVQRMPDIEMLDFRYVLPFSCLVCRLWDRPPWRIYLFKLWRTTWCKCMAVIDRVGFDGELEITLFYVFIWQVLNTDVD